MSDTRDRILDLAEDLTQTHGFNGFSYLDIANEIGIKHSSVHYHFKSKSDLALALVERLRDRHENAFEAFDNDLDTPEERLQALIEFFQGYTREKKFCMCGMMSAELQSFGPDVQRQIVRYFRDFESWLARQFVAMNKSDAHRRALAFVSALEGSLLLARLENDPKIVANALNAVIGG